MKAEMNRTWTGNESGNESRNGSGNGPEMKAVLEAETKAEMKAEMNRTWTGNESGNESESGSGNGPEMKAEMGKGMKRGNAVRGLTAEARVWCMFVPLK